MCQSGMSRAGGVCVSLELVGLEGFVSVWNE